MPAAPSPDTAVNEPMVIGKLLGGIKYLFHKKCLTIAYCLFVGLCEQGLIKGVRVRVSMIHI